ncbi:hypothetical protein PHLCEN_2v7930 [Hermanssonia centrifuga]|uniref:ATP-dependent DNA helicase n=1 Tax=Hermanssonia centrifuga TaxID=98765 RepID=A0A2R6NV42_9APHY|nr:hypothetical protein PHLCEN_2v7930 [Hermanssonia centrifuga]
MSQQGITPITADELQNFTVPEIRQLVGPRLLVPRSHSTPKSVLLDWIVAHADDELCRHLHLACAEKQTEMHRQSLARKRKRKETQSRQRQAARLEAVESHHTHDIDKYLDLPSDATLHQCSIEYIQATSDSSVQLSVCAICAREVAVKDDNVINIPLRDIPHQPRLFPHRAHAEHDLYDGMLLEPSGVQVQATGDEEDGPRANVCGSCHDQLSKDGTPVLSLANGLWIGRVPWELSVLTVPEQMLIAHLYPRVYVFKLFPRLVNFRPHIDSLQSAMRGNVSTYAQDLPGVASMLEGQMMPRPLEILSSVITITFIGKGQPQKEWFKSLFRVRREVVHNTLRCLKQINPHYAEMEISLDRLNSLPNDDIPAEIAELIRHNEDAGVVDEEAAGYVPEHPENIPAESAADFHTGSAASNDNQSAQNLDIPDVIPLQVSGSIDTDLTKLTSSELMLWGLSNLWDDGREGGYSIRHGSRPVPDLPPRRPSTLDNSSTSDNPAQNFFEHAFPCLFPYGCGGLEAPRTKHIDFRTHVQWCLQYHDRRFRKHITFPFLCFGIIQKRDALNSAHVQMLRADFERDAHVMTTLSVDKLREAQREEERGLPTSDPAVRLLRKHVHATAGRVVGTDQSRYRMRTLGTVESQGRGTLHLHMLLWLKNTPSGDKLEELLKSEDFRAKMRTFINANIRAYLPGLESAASVKAIPTDSEVSYSRPLNPASPTYSEDAAAFELKLARSLQVHTCKVRRCLVPDKQGRLKCKRKAPWEIAAEAFVTETGRWGPKRLNAFVNGYCPPIIRNLRCNNDCKILTNGVETKNITFYVTGYAAKKQGRNFNTSAILAEGFAYHVQHPNADYMDQLRHNQRLMLFRLIQAINCEQELSACMVMSYLMGWGDVYRSHQYTSVYWSSFVSSLMKAYPDLQRAPKTPNDAAINTGSLASSEVAAEPNDQPNDAALEAHADEFITLDTNSGGRIYARSQVTDYALRGNELERYSVYEFFLNTYETPRRKGKEVDRRPEEERTGARDDGDEANEEDDNGHPSSEASISRQRGRTAHLRSPYQADHPNAAQKERMVRTEMHKNMVNFVGKFFPSRSDATVYEFYCASMLMLFKPWRNISVDLKNEDESWSDAFSRFVNDNAGGSGVLKRRLCGIQTFHDGRAAAANDQRDEIGLPIDDVELQGAMHGIDDDDEEAVDGVDGVRVTAEDVEALIQLQVPPRERNHARQAVELAKNARIFADRASQWTATDHSVTMALGGDVVQLAQWQAQMDRDVILQNTLAGNVTPTVSTADSEQPSVEPIMRNNVDPGPSRDIGAQVEPSSPITAAGTLCAATPSMLKDDQFRAFDIVRWHLVQNLAGKKPPPLRMILYGEGGTGKSKVIQTITEDFDQRGVKSMLVKAAYTGVAASVIDGKTTHNIGGLSVKKRGDTVSDDSKAKLQQFWKNKQYLIIDKVSMISKSFLIDLERNISIGMQGAEAFQADYSFGGLNVLLCGDFHQFTPVAKGPDEYLFHPADLAEHSEQCVLGRRVYKEFSTVVILNQQMRVTDPVWRDLLVHLRKGEVKRAHIDCLRTLVISKSSAAVDFGVEPWKAVSLVTPRHAVRNMWNEHAARKWCAESGQQLFVCNAEDRIRKGGERVSELLSLGEQYALAMRGKSANRRRGQDLPRRVELAKGMKVLVTTNLETDLDLTNGARGEIIDIVLDPDEPAIGTDSIIHLKHLPLYVLVKMSRTRASHLPGLDEGVLPVQPMTSTMRIKLNAKTKKGKPAQRTVHRRQYPITPAYAFTDYRAQGQTLPYVLVDIASPPTGGLNLFNLYVALSRSSGRETIRLLRDFDEEVFTKAHDVELTVEDERLQELDVVTKRWWQVIDGELRMKETREVGK